MKRKVINIKQKTYNKKNEQNKLNRLLLTHLKIET